MLWLVENDRYDRLNPVPSQSADISEELRAQCESAMHVVKTDGAILRAGRAMLFCGRQTRWHQLARMGEWPIFLPFVELGYFLIARNRALLSKYFFRKEAQLPNSETSKPIQ